MLVESVDLYAMNNTKNLSTALSLGLLAALGGAALAQGVDDPRVWMTELPTDAPFWGGLKFSGDGSTIAFVNDPPDTPEVYLHTGGEWRVIYRYAGVGVYFPSVTGLSEDGSVLVLSDGSISHVYQDGLFVQLPPVWDDGVGMDVSNGSTGASSVSGDGRIVGVTGRATGNHTTYSALIWNGDRQLSNLSNEGNDYIRNWVSGLSNDGGVVFGTYEQSEPHNDIGWTNVSYSWVHEDGVMMDIPNLDLGFDLLSSANAISGNGEAIVGWSYGRWANEPDDESTDSILSPKHAWIWTRETGTVEVADPARFEGIALRDITDDATTVLGTGTSFDGESEHQLLWYRTDNRFVVIDDLLLRLGISINADWYSFDQISSDGSKLMGVSVLDGQYSAFTVTIPIRNTPISAAKP